MGFALGWMYWYIFTVTVPAEITAASLVVQYWNSPVNVAVWINIFMVVIIALNCFPVKYYEETEFWFASLKVIGVKNWTSLLDCGSFDSFRVSVELNARSR